MDSRVDKYRKGGIAERWVFTTLIPSLIAIALAFFSLLFFSRQNYYYSAQQSIGFRITAVLNNLPPRSASPEEKYTELVNMVESFSERERFEFMLLDEAGNVLITSGGFSYNRSAKERDFFDALEAEDGVGLYIGNSANNEHIIAVTQCLDGDFGDARAIRFVSSLKGIDSQISTIRNIELAVALVLFAMILITGVFFIKSMVVPLGKIGNTAKKVAAGDFAARLETDYTGEVGELCDIINDMATELQNSNNLKNDFISSISHEIRTPLTSIKGWGETLSTLGPEEDKIRNKGLEIIVSETERLQLLVEDLLDFSKLEANRALSLSRSPINICSELGNFVLTLEQRAKQLGLSVTYDDPFDEIIVFADRNKLKQVFTNIFDNAVKYSPRKGNITVSVSKTAENVLIRIKDEGPGIPKEEINKVTEKYYRASNSVYGTGIGLALVKEILAAHDGMLIIESELGHGTSMIVSLPLYTEV